MCFFSVFDNICGVVLGCTHSDESSYVNNDKRGLEREVHFQGQSLPKVGIIVRLTVSESMDPP